ncbi:MAG TPA: hypothetical protein VF144_10355 [Chitinophagaceae bacterium]
MKLLLLLFILLVAPYLSAQDSAYVTIKQGYKVGEVLPPADMYYYPQFTKGEVFFRTGMKATTKLNYARVYDEMQFIDPKGDTLALGGEKNIKFIAVGKDTFYYAEGYVRVTAHNEDVQLAEKQVWVMADIRKAGALNTSSSSVGITSARSFRNDGEVTRNNLALNEDVVLRKETQYYFGDDYNNFVRAGKRGLMQLFPKDERSISNYLKENKTDFNKKDDIEKLFRFLSQLH